jgi:hypothetical protein
MDANEAKGEDIVEWGERSLDRYERFDECSDASYSKRQIVLIIQ